MKKFADNLQNEMDKAINKINNLNYKKTETLSFEDFRDSNLLDDEDNTNSDKKEKNENIFDDTFGDIPEERPRSINIKPY